MTVIALLRCLLVAVGLFGILPEPARASASISPSAQGACLGDSQAPQVASPAERSVPGHRPVVIQGAGPSVEDTTIAQPVLDVRPPSHTVVHVLRPSSVGAAEAAGPVRLDRPPKHA